MHQSYTQIVSRIAQSSWGSEYKDKESAEKALLNDSQKLSAFASIELLRRLQAVCDAVGKEKSFGDWEKIYRPEDAAELPQVSIGDHLFEFDIEDGLSEFVVVAKGEDNTCLMVMLGDYDLKYGPTTRIADADTKTSKQEAMLHGALKKLKYEEDGVELAKKIRDCISAGLPVAEYENGLCEK